MSSSRQFLFLVYRDNLFMLLIGKDPDSSSCVRASLQLDKLLPFARSFSKTNKIELKHLI